ncbi:hypothetical protein [Marivirga atlantica]|uniref:Uncharacterized protein n=1 Tax=Marivirga atlantica TaxID=1548457 RepID=A0A937DH26_9BACT|nr:hypothetical protein [Marivirga atlantica]MBL0765438.1 hypothetical protein [Marivirga atlantica]
MVKTKVKILFLIASFCLASQMGKAQDISILDTLQKHQVEEDELYKNGLFRTQLIRKNGKYFPEDNNVFFTALIAYSLQELIPYFNAKDKQKAENIILKAKQAYPFYSNRNGGVTYNFYQTNPEMPFPAAPLFSNNLLPDDLDDTAIIYLSLLDEFDLFNHLFKLINEQSLKHQHVKSTLKQYQNSKAYRTWFANKMKQDLDICVISNVMLLGAKLERKPDSIAKASLSFINSVIQEELHDTKPHLVSPHYQSTTVILYHLARLLEAGYYQEISQLREIIIDDLYFQLKIAESSVDQIILLTSLIRLNEQIAFEIDLEDFENDIKTYAWFKGNPFTGSALFWKKLTGKNRLLQYKHRSIPYYWMLLLELKTMSKASFTQSDDGIKLVNN